MGVTIAVHVVASVDQVMLQLVERLQDGKKIINKQFGIFFKNPSSFSLASSKINSDHFKLTCSKLLSF